MRSTEGQGGEAEPRQTVALSDIEVEVPPGWEVRIREGARGSPQDVTKPVVHAATVPLPAERADFGGGVVETLGPQDVFVSLVEFGEEAVNSELFATSGEFPASVDASLFHPRQLQRLIPGQAGQQVFFTYLGRAFCLYVVIGSAALATELAAKATQLIQSISLDER